MREIEIKIKRKELLRLLSEESGSINVSSLETNVI